MTERQFWELMGLLDWKKLGNDDAVVRPLVKALAKLPEKELFAFDDALAEKLHALDTEAHARHMGEYSYKGPGEFFSVDEFLYTRCAVVANGKEVFERILADPTEFPEDAEFEAILYVAATAFKKKTGKEYSHSASISYETFSNKKGWPAGGKKTAPASAGPLVPPWLFRQELPQESSKWQRGEPAAYLKKWMKWFRTIPVEARNGYKRVFVEPKEWRGFYKSVGS